MKIMITGGAGFIGSSLVRLAIERGHTVINIDCLTYAANIQNLKPVEDSPNYLFEKIDIRDEEAIHAAIHRHKPEKIVHLAAESHVDRSIDEPGAFIQTNIVGTFNLLRTALAHWEKLSGSDKDNFRFHHISTDEVYGDLDVDDLAFSESHAYDPSSPYSASKAASDHLVRAWGRTYGLPVLITNCSNNYGPYQFPEKLIPVVILKALYGVPIPVYGRGENIRDWLFVDDHSEALLTVLAQGQIGHTYNIGGNNERNNLELVTNLCALMDAKLEKPEGHHEKLITFVEDRPGHDRRYAVNAEKITTELGWRPSVSWNEGFSKTIDWYLDNEWWWRPLIDSGAFGNRQGISPQKRRTQ